MRRRKVKGAKEKLLAYDGLVFEVDQLTEDFIPSLGWQGTSIWVEIGMGRGQFIIEYAKRYPDKNFIGIEIKEEVLLRALEKLENEAISNIRFILGNANLMTTFFRQQTVERIFINFCDPWPKKRWAKRRLTHYQYLDVYHQLLLAEGEMHFKTDAEDLFEFTVNEILSYPFMKLKKIQLNLHHEEMDIPTTEYEDKFSEEGLKIYRLEAINLFDKGK